MTTQPADKADKAETGAEALGEAVLSVMPPVVLPPLFAPSAGAFAAAAAIGMGFANQMTGAYLGFLRGAMEQSRVMAEALGVADTDLPGLAEEAASALHAVAAVPTGPGATILPMKRKAPVLVLAEPAEEVVAHKTPASAPAVEVKPAPPVAKARKGRGKPAKAQVAAKTKAPTKAVAEKTNTSDLKQIAGIGPKLESMLKARGVSTLADIAGLSEAEAGELDAALGLDGRIARDGWIKAAAALL